MRNLNIEKPRYFVNSLAKGLDLLQCFGDAGRALTLSELVEAMGSNSPTITRLCYTLTKLGFIQRDPQKRYHLTPKVLSLGCGVVGSLDWLEIARYFMDQLFEEFQETVNLSILEGAQILFVLRIRKLKYLPFDIRIGTKLPVHCTAMGKVLMAMGQPDKTRSILETLEFPLLTEHTIARMDRFLDELDQVRRKGYAINDREFSELLRTIAAPILNVEGHAVAAMSISVPTMTYSKEEMERRLGPRIIGVAQQISKALLQAENSLVIEKVH